MSSVTDRYVEHALRLVRVANGQNSIVARELRALAREIRIAIASHEASAIKSRIKMTELLAVLNSLIDTSYASLRARQQSAVAELVTMEAQWARNVGRFSAMPAEATIAATRNGLVVAGNTVDEHWLRQAQMLKTRVAAEVRLGIAAGQNDAQIASRIIGVGPDQRGGVMEVSRRDARGTADATTHAAADAGRRATMKANGVNGLKWVATLDTKVCPSCGERAGKLWTIEGEPIGHSIPYIAPPIHPWCRCLFAPMKFPPGKFPEDGGRDVDKFENWLERQSEEQQDHILGKGRAKLWREDKMTTTDLIGQNGMVLSLRDLKLDIESMRP